MGIIYNISNAFGCKKSQWGSSCENRALGMESLY